MDQVSLHFLSAARSEAGRRAANEDFYTIDEIGGLYVVADGTASRGGGDTAARIACTAVREVVGPQVQGLAPDAAGPIAQVLEQAIVTANDRILAAQQTNPDLSRMATTIVLALARERHLHVAYAGDSRAYLYRNGELSQITRDHSLENFLKDNPHVRPQVQRPGKTLLSALGLKRSQLRIDCLHQTLERDDMVLLCSDGLSDAIPGWILREILAGAYISTTLDETADQLVRSALSHGGMDNITTLLVHAAENKAIGDGQTVIFEPDAVPGSLAPASKVLGWLTFAEGKRQGETIPLEKRMTLGASPNCSITIQGDEYLSSKHAEVQLTEYGFVARDLDSTNGTYLNNVRIKTEPLVDGDTLRVGTTPLIFKNYRF